MATSTICPKKGTTAQWTASKRVLEVNEWGVEETESGKYIVRIGDGEHVFMELPAVIDVPFLDALAAQMLTQYNVVVAFRDDMESAASAANGAAASANTAATAAANAAAACNNIAAGINSMTDDTTEKVYTVGVNNGMIYLEEH